MAVIQRAGMVPSPKATIHRAPDWEEPDTAAVTTMLVVRPQGSQPQSSPARRLRSQSIQRGGAGKTPSNRTGTRVFCASGAMNCQTI